MSISYCRWWLFCEHSSFLKSIYLSTWSAAVCEENKKCSAGALWRGDQRVRKSLKKKKTVVLEEVEK